MTLTNVAVEPCIAVLDGVDFGLLDGDIEISMEEKAVEITGHQEGSNVLDMIRTGKSVELGLTLKETTVEKVTELLKFGGGLAPSAAAVTELTCVADVAGSLNNKYFFIYSAQDAVRYLVWFNVNAEGVAPVVSGVTLVEVALATDATNAQVATAVAAALDALSAFASTAALAVATITNAAEGVVSAPSMGNSGFSFTIETAGANALVGWGSSKDFTSMLADAKKLVLHPVKNAANVLMGDVAFWKAYPMIESIVHSGENPKTVSLTFKIFPDSSKPAAIRLFCLGDHS